MIKDPDRLFKVISEYPHSTVKNPDKGMHLAFDDDATNSASPLSSLTNWLVTLPKTDLDDKFIHYHSTNQGLRRVVALASRPKGHWFEDEETNDPNYTVPCYSALTTEIDWLTLEDYYSPTYSPGELGFKAIQELGQLASITPNDRAVVENLVGSCFYGDRDLLGNPIPSLSEGVKRYSIFLIKAKNKDYLVMLYPEIGDRDAREPLIASLDLVDVTFQANQFDSMYTGQQYNFQIPDLQFYTKIPLQKKGKKGSFIVAAYESGSLPFKDYIAIGIEYEDGIIHNPLIYRRDESSGFVRGEDPGSIRDYGDSVWLPILSRPIGNLSNYVVNDEPLYLTDSVISRYPLIGKNSEIADKASFCFKMWSHVFTVYMTTNAGSAKLGKRTPIVNGLFSVTVVPVTKKGIVFDRNYYVTDLPPKDYPIDNELTANLILKRGNTYKFHNMTKWASRIHYQSIERNLGVSETRPWPCETPPNSSAESSEVLTSMNWRLKVTR